jgi:hypothetical protein
MGSSLFDVTRPPIGRLGTADLRLDLSSWGGDYMLSAVSLSGEDYFRLQMRFVAPAGGGGMSPHSFSALGSLYRQLIDAPPRWQQFPLLMPYDLAVRMADEGSQAIAVQCHNDRTLTLHLACSNQAAEEVRKAGGATDAGHALFHIPAAHPSSEKIWRLGLAIQQDNKSAKHKAYSHKPNPFEQRRLNGVPHYEAVLGLL